jgi:2-hydroxychromene-2-carboxylate isomerase
LVKAYDVRQEHVQFPLHPDTPSGGIALAELFAGRGFDLNAMHARMKSLMDAEGLPYARRERTYNSRLAQELGKWGELAGRPGIHDALYRAYFVDDINISNPEDTIAVCAKLGYQPEEVRAAINDPGIKDLVKTEVDKAIARGAFGSPYIFVDDEAFWGADRLEQIEQWLASGGWKY